MLIMLASWAWAQERACPWREGGPVDATASLGRVTVAGVEYRVSGRERREQFRQVLQDCDASDALQHFEGWRSARITTNIGLAIPLVGWVGVAPFSAVMAGGSKSEMLRALQRDASNWETKVAGSTP
jgi:hypothetical protein